MADFEIEKVDTLSESELDSVDGSSVVGGGGSEIDDVFDLHGGADDSDDDDGEDEEDEEQDGEAEHEGEIEKITEDYEERDSSSDEEDDDEDDENYLQKMDDHIRNKVIENHHPELKTLNYEEVEALATVVRDKDGVIIDPLHKTLPILSRYEKARALGERARQINGGAKPMIEVDATMIDGYLIALKELEQKRIPFIIQRPLPNGGSEYWRLSDLEMV
jgi:DNA-directed RNA polymerase I, II, and III subunit RPABC2